MSYTSHREAYDLLNDINRIFERLGDGLDNTPEVFSLFFVRRTHASYLGAVRLSISAQLCEAYMVLRGCLENALYGLYFFKNPESRRVWLNRHDNAESRRLAGREVKYQKLLACLKSANKHTSETADELYDRTIDYGAHPNERALSQSLTRLNLTKERWEFSMSYLSEDFAPFRACLLTSARVGVCSLDIFREVFKERFDILGISDDLGNLRERTVTV